MNLLFDLKEILYDNRDNEHEMRITVDPYEIKVELLYDPELSEEVLTILYNIGLGFAYTMKDYGIDTRESKLAYDIMSYLELHGAEISDFCDSISLHNCERYSQKVKIDALDF